MSAQGYLGHVIYTWPLASARVSERYKVGQIIGKKK